MRAWIDRTNDGLSGMPADGISLPPKKGDFGTSRWAGSKVRLHQPRHRAEGGMTACGTSRRTEGPEPTSGFGVKQTLSIDGNDAIDPFRTL